MSNRVIGIALIALLSTAVPAGAKELPASFLRMADVKVEVVPEKAKRGETVIVRFTIDLKPEAEAHTYPFFPKDPTQDSKNSLSLPVPSDPAAGGLIFLKGATDPSDPPLLLAPREDAKNGELDQYYGSTVTWEFKAVVSPDATSGKKEVGLGKKTFIQVCKTSCIRISGDVFPKAPFEVLDGTSDKVNSADLAAAVEILNGGKKTAPIAQPVVANPPVAVLAPANALNTNDMKGRKNAKPIDLYSAELATVESAIDKLEVSKGANGSTEKEGLGPYILTAALWGLISLITPCVFPMIPITVSIFLKHAHGSLGERLKLAGVYCLTIITVLGVSAFALLKFMAWLSTNPITNILLGILFLVLALSLFGMYELTLPNFLSRRLQAKQAKGGVVGTIFGALAFTVISFTCVAPFLGGFAGISSADTAGGSMIAVPTAREIAGGLAFATAFAAPFFVLALIPGLLKALPRSGGWLDSVKVVMGFLELAAALKFLRTAEVRLLPTSEYFTFELVLGGWVAISLACGLYLLNLYRLPHDEEKPNIGVMRLLFALLFLGLGIYLLPATFKGPDGNAQRPTGAVYAWVEAFLLPEVDNNWGTDLKDAIERSRKAGQPVFVDFTGKTCTNCKYNESHVFSRPEIRLLFEKFEKVQLYTDEVPEKAYSGDPGTNAREMEAENNRKFQVSTFGDIALPLYAVVLPQANGKVKILGKREGKINDPAAFASWLKESLERAKQK